MNQPRPGSTSRYLRFAEFEVDRDTRELRCRGERASIQEKPLRLLEALLLADGEVVTRAELQRRLWPDGTFVEYEAGIHTAVRKLRLALGDSAREPRWVETLPGVGYRFLGVVEVTEEESVASYSLPPMGRRGFALAVALLLGWGLFALLPSSRSVLEPEEDVAVAKSSRGAASSPLPSSSDARRSFLEGRFLKEQQTPEALAKASRALSEVVLLEPDFAPGHAELGWVLARRSLIDGPRCRDCLVRARQSVDQALAIDDGQIVALLADGMIALFFDWDRERAGESVRRALERAPSSAEAHLALATWLSATGAASAAVDAVQRAIELEPESLLTRSDAGFFLLAAGRPLEAIDECRRVLALDPDFLPARGCLLQAYEREGQYSSAAKQARALMEAREASARDLELLDEAGEEGPKQLDLYREWVISQALSEESISPVALAAGYAAAGQPELAFDWLERAFDGRDPQLALMLSYVAFEPLQTDPRFEELVASIGLAHMDTHHRTSS